MLRARGSASRPSSVATSPLPSTNPASTSELRSGSSSTMRTSKSIPSEKKRLPKVSRSGIISAIARGP